MSDDQPPDSLLQGYLDMTRAHIDHEKDLKRQLEALVRSLNRGGRCFTCGAPASREIVLERGCFAFPDVKGIVKVCLQHALKIEPL